MAKVVDLDRKAAVLLYEKNKFIVKAREESGSTDSNSLFLIAFGVTRGAATSWVENPQKNAIGSFNKIITHLEKKWGFEDLTIEDCINDDVFEFSKKICLRREDAQRAMDEAVDNQIKENSRYYVSRPRAVKIMEDYGGVYEVILPVWSKETNIEFMRCALRVRTLFRANNKGVYAIRCKINIPPLKGNAKGYFEYIGKMIERPYMQGKHLPDQHRCHWFFEQKPTGEFGRRPDFLTITSVANADEPNYMSGILSSVNQDNECVAYASPVFFQKKTRINNRPTNKIRNTDKAVKFMQTSMKTFPNIDALRKTHPKAAAFFESKGYKKKGDTVLIG